MMSFFGEEAKLYAKEYDAVEAMRAMWSADIQRFFEALHPEVEKLLDEKVHTRPTSGYRYWWRDSAVPPSGGTAMLWSAREYPELIRDQSLLWEAYLETGRNQHANEATHVAWRQRGEAGLRGAPGVEVGMGAASSFRPLNLRFRWKVDPVAETAEPIARALDVLYRAVLEVGKVG